jgi:hypothetical protein
MEANKPAEDQKFKSILLRISIALFIVSLTQKCYCTAECADSIMVFLLGWAGIASGGFAWLANPLLILSWFNLKKNLKTAMFLSVAAFLVSFSFLLVSSISDNESGIQHQIVSYKPGYWLWLSSSTCMLIGSFALMLRSNTRKLKSKIR